MLFYTHLDFPAHPFEIQRHFTAHCLHKHTELCFKFLTATTKSQLIVSVCATTVRDWGTEVGRKYWSQCWQCFLYMPKEIKREDTHPSSTFVFNMVWFQSRILCFCMTNEETAQTKKQFEGLKPKRASLTSKPMLPRMSSHNFCVF